MTLSTNGIYILKVSGIRGEHVCYVVQGNNRFLQRKRKNLLLFIPEGAETMSFPYRPTCPLFAYLFHRRFYEFVRIFSFTKKQVASGFLTINLDRDEVRVISYELNTSIESASVIPFLRERPEFSNYFPDPLELESYTKKPFKEVV